MSEMSRDSTARPFSTQHSALSTSVSTSLAAALFVLLAVAMTWPLLPNLRRAVTDPGDPFINIWVLDWDWYATRHQPLSLFEANAFYPAKDSLAYSESIYGIALLLFPLRAAGVDALTAHNVAMLLGFAFSGFAVYLLGRMISGSALAGIAAGVFYAFVPFRFTHLPHLQYVFAGWPPMMLVALLHYARRPAWGRAALFGAAFLMNGLSNIHWLFFGSVVIALSVPIALARPRDWLRVAAATAVALLLLAPFLYPYHLVSTLYGMRRTASEVMDLSAMPRDWLNPGVANRLYRRLADVSVDPERWLFPGALSIALAIPGIVLARRERRPLAIALLWIAIGFLGSLGLHAFFYRLLFDHLPGFAAFRAPVRWANVAYVGLAMLVAFAVAPLARRWRWAAAVVVAMFVIELRAAPIRWYVALRDVPAVYRWLAAQPVRIIEVPFGTGEMEYVPMRWATVHHRPMANGILGFVPPEYLRLARLWRAPEVSDEFVDELRRIGIDLIVVRGDEVFDRERAWLRRELARERLSFVRRFDRGRWGDWVFTTATGRAKPASTELEAFLRGQYSYNDITFGILDSPLPGRMGKKGWFTGYALSPWDVRKVNLLFNNGAIRIPAYLKPDSSVAKAYPWYPVATPRFMRAFERRPPGVRRLTDVQVEIVDGRGERTLLEDRWIEWSDE